MKSVFKSVLHKLIVVFILASCVISGGLITDLLAGGDGLHTYFGWLLGGAAYAADKYGF